MAKLRHEISEKCTPDVVLDRDTLRKLPYLQNVLKESASTNLLFTTLL